MLDLKLMIDKETKMIIEEIKKIIDGMNYEQLLKKWRFSPVGDPFFHGEIGEYYNKIMKKKRLQISDIEFVQISENVGW